MKLIHNVMNAVLNGIMTSTFEEGVWELTVLILLKRFDLLDKYMWKEKIKYLAFPVLLSSLVINTLKYIIVAPRLIISLSAIITIYVGIIYILKAPENNILNEKIPYIKTFFYVLSGFIVLIIMTEYLYINIILKYIGKSIIEVNSAWYMNFLMSIPAKLIQFVMVMIILFIQTRKNYLDVFKSIFYDKKFSIIIMSFVLMLIVFWIILIDIFGDYEIISHFNYIQQILLNIIILTFPSILLILMISLVVCFIEIVAKIQMSHRNMFEDFDDDINDY